MVFTVFENPDAVEVILPVMQAAIALGVWFRSEATRLYASYAESPEQTRCRELVDLVQRHGGRITARELWQSSRKYRPTSAAEKALEELIAAGYGKWETSAPDSAGRPKVEFVLSEAVTPVTVTELPEIKEKTNCVTSNHVTTTKNYNSPPPDDDQPPISVYEADAAAEVARQAQQEEVF